MFLCLPLLIALSSCATPAGGAAGPQAPLDYLPALKGDYFRIESENVGRPFHIYVRYPENYEAEPERRYPVVYLLDGDSLFPILAANHLFLGYDEGLPEAIVVGIAYGAFDPSVNLRHIDFMPPGDGVDPASAGAPVFQAFLKDELLPLVESRYRADPTRRVLFGQSRGGSFVLYSAFTDPDLFWGRIASNPTLEPDRSVYFATPAPASRSGLGLVVASGSRDGPNSRANFLEWAQYWEGREAPWALLPTTIPDGTHAASSPSVYRAGMLWLFADELGD